MNKKQQYIVNNKHFAVLLSYMICISMEEIKNIYTGGEISKHNSKII